MDLRITRFKDKIGKEDGDELEDALEGIGWLLGPAGGVNGGLEAARSKGVLGLDGIKDG